MGGFNHNYPLEADKDLENIFGYGIEHFGVESALIFYDALNDVFNRICNNPEYFQSSTLNQKI